MRTTGLVLLGLMGSVVAPALAVTLDVTTTLDTLADDGLCSLREAVIASNTDTASGVTPGECPAGSGTDTIVLQAETYTLTRGVPDEDESRGGDLDVVDSVVILGADQATTVISGGDIDRVFHLRNTAFDMTVTMMDFTITGGLFRSSGGAILNRKTLILDSVRIRGNRAEDGAGIFNSGTLQMFSCQVGSNEALDDGGGIFITRIGQATIVESKISGHVAGGTGGGIYNDGSLELDRSTVASNQSVWGAGIHSLRDLIVTESTIAANIALRWGGGMANEGSAVVTNSTFGKNTAVEYAGNIANMPGGDLELLHSTIAYGQAPVGSAVHNDATVRTSSSIFQGACDGTGLTSNGGNVESPARTCNLNRFKDRMNVTDEELDLGTALGDHGGPTRTIMLGPSSVAIDRGRTVTCLDQDQRGFVRPIDGNEDGRSHCDSGAFEYSPEFFADGFETGDTSRWTETHSD